MTSFKDDYHLWSWWFSSLPCCQRVISTSFIKKETIGCWSRVHASDGHDSSTLKVDTFCGFTNRKPSWKREAPRAVEVFATGIWIWWDDILLTMFTGVHFHRHSSSQLFGSPVVVVNQFIYNNPCIHSRIYTSHCQTKKPVSFLMFTDHHHKAG